MENAPETVDKSRGRLTDEVCKRIADDIVLGHFAPGARLEEYALAERYGVSRTPVREAIKLLAISGLVVYKPNRGASVAQMTPEQLDYTFEAIGELEAACARHAALRMNEAERARLAALHEASRAALQSRDMETYSALNVEFHELIMDAAHNPVLKEVTAALRTRVTPFRRTQFRDFERIGASFAEHATIVEALLSGDALGAFREMRAHLLSARSASQRLSPLWGKGEAV